MTKQEYTEKLTTFFRDDTCPDEGIHELRYEKEGLTEWVYVVYESYSLRRFNVTGDSNRGIFIDFSKFLQRQDNYPWLMGEEYNRFFDF